MCTHLYKNSQEFCDFNISFHKDLPLHPQSGNCIFHSEDKEWKRENQCLEWFRKLIIDQDKKGEIELYDFSLVGEPVIEEHQETLEDSENAIFISNFIIRNDITLYDCIFYDEVWLQRGIFNAVTSINNCKFHKGFLIDQCSFREDTNVESNCRFCKEFYITNGSIFAEQTSIIKNTFDGEISIDNSYFELPLHIINNQFTSSDYHVTFSSKFMHGLSFDKNNYSGLLSFFESELHETSTVEDNDGSPSINLSHSKLFGVLRFEGTEDNLLFQSKAEIKLEELIFEQGGSIMFDYCNMLNLSQEFLLELRNLEKENKVFIHDSCRLFSFHTVFEYKTHEINDAVFMDFHNLVSRYFKQESNSSIDISFLRSENNNSLKVYYSSIDDLSEKFNDYFEKILLKISEQKAEDIELEIQRQAILMRLGHQVHIGQLDEGLEFNLRSNFKTLPVQPINVLVDQILIASGGTLKIDNATVESIDTDKIIINNLLDLKKSLQFKLNDTQFDLLKAEISSIGNLSEINKNIANILNNQKSQLEKESDVKEFLTTHGVSVIGSMTGATLFTFLKLVFPM